MKALYNQCARRLRARCIRAPAARCRRSRPNVNGHAATAIDVHPVAAVGSAYKKHENILTLSALDEFLPYCTYIHYAAVLLTRVYFLIILFI